MRNKIWIIIPVVLGLSGCTYLNNLFDKQQAPAPVFNQGQDNRFYTVQPGDTLFSISQGFNVTERTLILWNQLQAPYKLEVGQTLRVRPNPCEPVQRADGTQLPLPANCQPQAPAPSNPAPAVQSSTTPLASSQLESQSTFNSRSPIPPATVPPTTTSTSQQQQVVASTPSQRTANARGIYIVQTGDTLAAVASSFGVTINDLMTWNNLDNANHIWVGQRLRVVAPDNALSSPTVVTTSAVSVSTPRQTAATQSAPAIPTQSAPTRQMPVVTPTTSPSAPQPQTQAATPSPAVPTTGANVPSGKVVNNLQWRWPLAQRGQFTLASVNSDGLIGTTSGANVLAAADGTVLYSGVGTGGYGQMVILNHGDGYISAYMNLNRTAVSENQPIKAGATLGQVGRFRGESNLGFEIRLNGNTQPLGNFYNL